MIATAQVLGDGALTVSRIVERAGVGRSTFYEFFDSPEHVLQQLEQRAVRGLEAALEGAFSEVRTPLERVRALTRSWTLLISSQRDQVGAVLARERRASAALSPLGEVLLRALTRCVELGRHEAGWFKTADDVALLAAVAAIEAVTRRHLATRVDELPKVLSELAVKLLR